MTSITSITHPAPRHELWAYINGTKVLECNELPGEYEDLIKIQDKALSEHLEFTILRVAFHPTYNTPIKTVYRTAHPQDVQHYTPTKGK